VASWDTAPVFARLLTAVLTLAAVPASGLQTTEYRDPESRFVFAYPPAFGATSVGTDNGFANRVAAIRFSIFSVQGIGGEAVLGKGPPSLDLQAAGGLYHDIASGTMLAPMVKAVAAVLPRLTLANLCQQVAREQHVDPTAPAFAALPENQRLSVGMMDRLGNLAPKVYRCDAVGDTIVFDKDAAMSPGGGRRRVYGAVRFLSGRYSMFEIVRAGGTPSGDLLDQILLTVQSFRVP
jgi:hypothetical protein